MAEVALRTGAVIDERYALRRMLGAGGCGAVWLAADRGSNDADEKFTRLKTIASRISSPPRGVSAVILPISRLHATVRLLTSL